MNGSSANPPQIPAEPATLPALVNQIRMLNVHLSHAPYLPYQLLKIPYANAPFIKTAAEAISEARKPWLLRRTSMPCFSTQGTSRWPSRNSVEPGAFTTGN